MLTRVSLIDDAQWMNVDGSSTCGEWKDWMRIGPHAWTSKGAACLCIDSNEHQDGSEKEIWMRNDKQIKVELIKGVVKLLLPLCSLFRADHKPQTGKEV